MSLHKFEQHERRLVILRLLAEDADFKTPSSVLESGLETFALAVSRDALHTELHWLQEQGLVALEEVTTIYTVELTPRGLDVAKGRAIVPGVKRPGPAGK